MTILTNEDAVEAILKYRPNFLDGVSNLNLRIMPGDGMLGEGDIGLRYYYECGRSALDLIDTTLMLQGKPRVKIQSVLDFACGFGRVTRWLRAVFPDSDYVALDVDQRAISAIRENFGIDARKIAPSWTDVPESRFDLIWVGSLFTHLSERRSRELAQLLYARLTPGGILAATFHGKYVVDRIRSREKTYGASESGHDLLIGYDSCGYGFSQYPNMPDYGISATNLPSLHSIMTDAKLEISHFVERGWVKHQDFVACHR